MQFRKEFLLLPEMRQIEKWLNESKNESRQQNRWTVQKAGRRYSLATMSVPILSVDHSELAPACDFPPVGRTRALCILYSTEKKIMIRKYRKPACLDGRGSRIQ